MMAHAAQASFRAVSQRRPPPPLRLMREADHFDCLLRRVAQTRDRAAFQELFQHFAPRLKAYGMRLGSPAQIAEDVAQEAMLTLWRKAALFDPGKASAATWIFTIARNLRIDLLRRERLPRPEDADPESESEPDAGETFSARQSEEALRQALGGLPPEQKEIVMLSFFSDKPHSEIAAQLNIPLGTVKSRLRLAMVRLRAGLGDKA